MNVKNEASVLTVNDCATSPSNFFSFDQQPRNNNDSNNHLCNTPTENQTSQENNDPPFFFWNNNYNIIPFKYQNAPIEATGLSLDAFGRATIYISAFFLGPALMQLASNSAIKSCQSTILLYSNDNNNNYQNEIDDCMENATVYGFKPSSLLTNIVSVSGFLAAAILPLVGAIIDYTPYRKQIGLISALVLVAIKLIEYPALGNPNTWFMVALLQIISNIAYQIHVSVAYAYSSELSPHPLEQSEFQTHFGFIVFSGMIVLMLLVIIPSFIFSFHDDDIAVGRWALLLGVILSVAILPFTWMYLFRNRPGGGAGGGPASSNNESNKINYYYLISIGFTRLYKTYKMIQSDLPSVKYFLISILFSEGAHSTFGAIITAFMTEYLQLSATQAGQVVFLLLVTGLPGCKLGHYITARTNPLVSIQICLSLYIITILAGAWILRPQTNHYTYMFGMLWGICLGWLHPQHTTIFVSIIPKGSCQQVELMGLFIFACHALSFIPPLLFSIINEIGLEMYWGFASLSLFLGFGLFLLLNCFGSFGDAMQQARLLPTRTDNHYDDGGGGSMEPHLLYHSAHEI